METLIIQPKTQKQLDAIKAVLKALNVPFKKKGEGFYNPEFVAKIKKASENVEKGEFVKVDPDKGLWEYLI